MLIYSTRSRLLCRINAHSNSPKKKETDQSTKQNSFFTPDLVSAPTAPDETCSGSAQEKENSTRHNDDTAFSVRSHWLCLRASVGLGSVVLSVASLWLATLVHYAPGQ